MSNSKRFLALGDSYTIGEGVEPAERWPVQLVRLLRDDRAEIADPEIIAKTGWTTDELAQAIERSRVQGPFDLVSLLIGVNNQYRARRLDEFRQQYIPLLQTAVEFADGKAEHVIVLSIPDWGATPFAQDRDRQQIGLQIDKFNAVCRSESERLGTAFVDVTAISRWASSDGGLIAGDGLHPSAKMYRKWAEIALPFARSALKA
jgi:lysophospholipase L1-like esterase